MAGRIGGYTYLRAEAPIRTQLPQPAGISRGTSVGITSPDRINRLRYYVVFPNGQRYGPADVRTLQLWVAENRVGPATVLEEEGSGRSMLAHMMPELGFGAPQAGPSPSSGQYGHASQTTYSQPYQGGYSQPQMNPYGQANSPYTGYHRSNPYARPASSGNTETVWAFVLGALGLVCCQVFSIGGIILGAIGMSKGQKSAGLALGFSIITFLAHFVLGALFWNLVPQ